MSGPLASWVRMYIAAANLVIDGGASVMTHLMVPV